MISDDIGNKAYIPPDVEEESTRQTQSSSSISKTNVPNNETITQPMISNNFEGGIFSINYYRRYFNINTLDFFQNILNSINIISQNKESINMEQEIGDLYGPIWITATVIFCLFFSNTSSNLIKIWFIGSDDEHYNYNFNLLTGAISLLYGYTLIIPLFFYILSIFYFKLQGFFTLSKIISIYGYANSVWIPSAILGIIRGLLVNHVLINGILKWIVVLIGGIISGISIGLKVYPVLKNSNNSNEKLIFGLMSILGIAHLGFIIAIKVLFFGDLKVVN